MDAADRQLTGAQRLNIQSARSYFVFFFFGLGVVLLPLLLLAGGCAAFFLTADSIDGASLLFVGSGTLPFLLGVGASTLALRYVHRRGVELEARCAAAPPLAEGHPARCHVCGAPLEVHARRGIARCGFCQADNLVSEEVLARIGVHRHARVGQLFEQVQGEARALDKSALSAGAAAFATVLFSPVLGFALFVGVAIVGMSIETDPLPDAVYALVPTANTRCIVQVVRAGSRDVLEHGYDRPLGAPERSAAPTDLTRLRSADLIGRELGRESSRRGKLKRVYRTGLARSIDYAELDAGDRSASAPVVGLCEPSGRRRSVAADARFEGATRMRADGDHLLISAGALILSVPKAGGAASVSLESEHHVIDFQRKGAALVVHQTGGQTAAFDVLERREGGQAERLAEDLESFAVDGEAIWIGKKDGLYRRDASGQVTQIDAAPYASNILVERDAVYWSSSRGEIRELTKASNRVRLVGTVMQALALARVGQHLYVSDKVLKASFVPLAGGSQVVVEGNDWAASHVQSDGKAAYFGVVASGRGGVASLVPGQKEPTGARHYGIDTREPKAFAVDGGEVFWMDGETMWSEPVLPP